jgi:L-alanine-DL-glutamate epimerase-like enolase superfamily enzyme
MKITDISTVLLVGMGKHVGMPDSRRTASLILVETDAGLTGLGESYAGLYVPQLVPHFVELYKPLLVGEDPAAINRLWHKMSVRSMRWGLVGLPIQVMSGIEMALWDLKGKALKVPVYELFGGLAQKRLRLYASAYASPWPPEKTAEKVRHFAVQGFNAVKLATGFWGRDRTWHTPSAQVVEEECEKLRAIRDEVGYEVDICLDNHAANNPNAWSADTAIQVIGALDEYALLWFEQPCDPRDVDAHAKLRASVRTPIAGAEDVTTLQELNQFLQKEALDVIQPDVAWMGMVPVHKTFGLAQGYGVRATLHVCGSTGVAMAANYHLALANHNCFIAERSVEENPLFTGVLVEPLDIRDGFLYPPTAPGLGVNLDEAKAKQYAYTPQTWYASHQPGRAAQA